MPASGQLLEEVGDGIGGRPAPGVAAEQLGRTGEVLAQGDQGWLGVAVAMVGALVLVVMLVMPAPMRFRLSRPAARPRNTSGMSSSPWIPLPFSFAQTTSERSRTLPSRAGSASSRRAKAPTLSATQRLIWIIA